MVSFYSLIIFLEDEHAGRFPHKECHSLDPGVQLLPRQDVLLYGTFPKMEPRVYSKCRECNRVFNPCDISSHKSCSKTQNSVHPSILKKKMKSKSGIGKKTSTISNTDSNLSSSNNNTSIVTQQSGIFKVIIETLYYIHNIIKSFMFIKSKLS